MSKITTKETNKLKKELEKNIKIFNQYIVFYKQRQKHQKRDDPVGRDHLKIFTPLF